MRLHLLALLTLASFLVGDGLALSREQCRDGKGRYTRCSSPSKPAARVPKTSQPNPGPMPTPPSPPPVPERTTSRTSCQSEGPEEAAACLRLIQATLTQVQTIEKEARSLLKRLEFLRNAQAKSQLAEGMKLLAEARKLIELLQRSAQSPAPRRPDPPDEKPRTASGQSQRSLEGFWSFNQSMMNLVLQRTLLIISYELPRAELIPLGIRRETLFFVGAQDGQVLHGIAHTFFPDCSPIAYSVEGEIIDYNLRIRLHGKRPRPNKGCEIESYDDIVSELRFLAGPSR